MENEQNEKRGVQSIGVGLRILEALTTADSALSLTALARASKVPSSSCHRYLTSFTKAGYVVQNAISGRYDLGPRIIQAGLAALRRADPILVALSACERLVERTGRTAQLAIWSDDGPVIVGWRMGKVPIPTNLAVGSRLPMFNSATGRAFFSYLPEVFWERFLRRENCTISVARKLASSVMDAGFASVSGDLIPGLSAIAAPLLDARGMPVAVITLLALRDEICAADSGELIAATQDASAQLGFGSKGAL
ncbi:IclR family transcriptional regulator [Aquisediminimonas profunda]|uniref:IclR family transcriptional regulator n=1 Tax=Aquisediminimonas profunda TaxID=1550733 RepID=UPI001C637488|nr:IclR family transcriptional regulator [Aquisediminimonas profunda]